MINCKVPVYKKIQKNKLLFYREKNKVCSSKGKIKAVSLKQEKNLYASMFVACQLRDCNLSEFFEHEKHSYPSSLSEYGKIQKTSKSDFLSCLELYGTSSLASPEVTTKVIDSAAVVQNLKPTTSNTFGEYSVNEFQIYALHLRCLISSSKILATSLHCVLVCYHLKIGFIVFYTQHMETICSISTLKHRGT